MYCKSYAAGLEGLEAQIVEVEVDVSKGLPAFNIVGMADRSINEARERVKVALRSSDFPAHPKKVIVNLAPAKLKKEGAQFDLAIAAALMLNFGYLDVDANFLEKFCLLSELSLTGKLKAIRGVLPLALSVAEKGIEHLIISKANQKEASLALFQNKKLKLFAVEDLLELKDLIEGLDRLSKVEDEETKTMLENKIAHYQCPKIKLEDFKNQKLKQDFKDVVGQKLAKRGLEIAAAGGHHCLMIGPPGCGKSMLAKRFSSILPELDFNQALETTKIYSICGLLKETLVTEAPVRAPHHSASAVSLIGGSYPPKPGEASLAHNGVLFLDELTEFKRFVLDQFREVLDNHEITLSKNNKTFSYPANFTLVAACNPCPCGYLGDELKACNCTPYQISRYISRLSGPFLDRVDIHIQLDRLSKEEMYALGESTDDNLSSQDLQKNVAKAITFRKQRSKKVKLNKEVKDFLHEAVTSLDLSARAHDKILKISRTIADLAESEMIKLEHVAEALQYRSLNWESYAQGMPAPKTSCFELAS